MIKIYHTQGPIWWNTGNEVKPNRAALESFTWKECENFNVSWIDETHIQVIVPTNHTTTMIKITDDSQQPADKYFYLLEVLNRTTANHECIYELDIWLTYLDCGTIWLPETTKTIRTLDVNTVGPNINIEPVGVPTGNIAVETVSFTPTIEEGLERKYLEEPTIENQKLYPGITTNIYYVFKAKRPTNYSTEKFWRGKKYSARVPNYILVPLLNLEGYGFTKTYDIEYRSYMDLKKIAADILNSYTNINVLINRNADFGVQGLGEFIGIWVGPNYFRLKEKGMPIIQSDFGQPWLDKSDKPVVWTEDILVAYNNSAGWQLSHEHTAGKGAFLALRVDSMPLSMTPLNLDKTIFLRGLRYQENQDNHLTVNANSVNFNQAFNYTNGVETTSVDIQVPIAYDNYYNLLAAQRNTLNTSLALSGVNAIVQGASSSLGFIPPAPSTTLKTYNETKDYFQAHLKVGNHKKRITQKGPKGGLITMGWEDKISYRKPKSQKQNKTGTISTTHNAGFGLPNILGGIPGLVNAGIQFISTLANQQAYRDDLRTKLSATVLNGNDKYVSWYKIAQQVSSITDINNSTTDMFIQKLAIEIFSGPETDPGIAYKFYGVDCQPQAIEILSDTEAYLQVDENTALSAQNMWGAQFTPIIKEAMLSLITNGVRIARRRIK